MYNNQSVIEFVVVGFASIAPYHTLLFIVFLFLYIIITSGNGITFVVIVLNDRLHIPMYLFIGALSIVEICIVTTVYPTTFTLFLKGRANISLHFCLLQMYAFDAFLITENFLLSIMAYDRYLAVCMALRYHSIMTSKLCKIFICLCWLLGMLSPLAMISMVYRLPFCGPNEIEHLFCDSSPLLTLACANSNLDVTMDLTVTSFSIILNSIITVIIYTNILVTIFKMKTSEERRKAFSTCLSHLLMSLFFYGSAAFMYMNLQSTYSPAYDLAASIHHSVFTPLLSPLVYSFRNKEIKNFLKKQLLPKTLLIRRLNKTLGNKC
ncbi:olfactory receptor 6N1-like [Hyla sarda]|uniref:olfactory receptor 6N1-like n=1 Tax=Hyla sarda TaxID=327740 RepID=UPI0024C27B7C|nr:olfactory receptor 6N1-like [Hyla sarda]